MATTVFSKPVDTEVNTISKGTIYPQDFTTCADMYSSAPNGSLTIGITALGAVDNPTSTGYWTIQQQKSNDRYGYQFAAQTNTNDIYFRNKESGTWSSWEKIVLSSNIANFGKIEVLSGVSSSVGTVDSRYLSKVNELVTVFIALSLTSAISGSTVVLTGLPKSYQNYTQVRILNASTADFLDGYIDNTGKLTVKGNASSGNSLRFCVTYMFMN